MSVTPAANFLSELLPSTGEVPLVHPSEGYLGFRKDGLAASGPDREVEEGYEKGFADGIAKAKEELDEVLASQQLERESQETTARLRLMQDGIEGLLKKLAEQQKEKASAVQSMVSEVLRSLIEKGALSAAMAQIEGLVERELDGKTNARIQLRGPENIVSELAEQLTTHDFDVDVIVADVERDSNFEVQVQVQIDSSVIRTRLSDWKQAMEGLLK